MGTPAAVPLVSPAGDWRVGGDLWVHAWTSGDNREAGFVYFWAEHDADPALPIEFRVLRAGAEVAPWRPVAGRAAVFAATGIVDQSGRPQAALPVGGAERLAAGVYELELRLAWAGRPYVLSGIRFEVAPREAPHGGWQLRPPPGRGAGPAGAGG